MNSIILKKKSLPLLGVLLAIIFWAVDAFLDTYFFTNQHTFVQNIFTNNLNELWMRSSTVIVIVIFSLYAKKSEKTKSILLEKLNETDFLETVDPVTLLFNKRKFYELLEYEMEKDKRYKLGLSIIFCSIDNYKNICNTYSHSITDNLLSNIALQLVKSLRTSDVVTRWAEQEFLIIIPTMTAEQSLLVAEKIRNIIENNVFEDVGKITASFGVTQFIEDDNKVTIVNRASAALNAAQEKGLNRVEIIE